MIRTYSDLIKLKTHKERFEYLRVAGEVGFETFGSNRYLNQMLYTSNQWRQARSKVIIRDNGFDLGIEPFEIFGIIVVHHMNSVTIEDIINNNPDLFNPEFLISSADLTHKAMHYGNYDLLPTDVVERSKNDTSPWLK